ncbi:hypothetical protein FA15DRAFT_371933 [Coprinopsis marcescibilis]|uniref:Uncharacterized protein n=1 Tax=Coprinopsis marcescibilis TaxID=230819 RepID=A0A5C3KAQ2_COPMA|nr:hypothetical protein FA15DRAFT_371933 [Coprinopsis marcescibilis]
MLIVFATLQSHRDWFGMFNCPMECVIRDLRPGGSPLRWSIVSYTLLLWGYGTAIWPLLFEGPWRGTAIPGTRALVQLTVKTQTLQVI